MPYVRIERDDIFFNPKVQEMCISPSFKCPFYNHSWSCPPNAPYLEKQLNSYKEFYLIYSRFDLESYIQKQKQKHPNRSTFYIKSMFMLRKHFILNNLEEEINTFLEQYRKTYKKKLILWDGTCRYCLLAGEGKCSFDDGKPCRFPLEKRYSMEAVGIEVIRTVLELVKSSRINIKYPSEKYSYRFGLACFK